MVHLRRSIKLSFGVTMLTMQGQVKSWLGLADTVQLIPWSILPTGSLLSYMWFLIIMQESSAFTMFVVC